MNEIIVHVKEKHIENGARMDSCECPIALAIKEQYPKMTGVSVDINMVKLNGEYWFIDDEGGQFIWDYDMGSYVRPIDVTLTRCGVAELDLTC